MAIMPEDWLSDEKMLGIANVLASAYATVAINIQSAGNIICMSAICRKGGSCLVTTTKSQLDMRMPPSVASGVIHGPRAFEIGISRKKYTPQPTIVNSAYGIPARQFLLSELLRENEMRTLAMTMMPIATHCSILTGFPKNMRLSTTLTIGAVLVMGETIPIGLRSSALKNESNGRNPTAPASTPSKNICQFWTACRNGIAKSKQNPTMYISRVATLFAAPYFWMMVFEKTADRP